VSLAAEEFVSNRVALVTGAAGGIGRAVAQRFIEDGWSVALVDIGDAVEVTARELGEKHQEVKITAHRVDITQPDAVVELATSIEREHGRLDTVALVAGVVQQAAGISELDLDEWQRVLSVNLTGPYLVCHATVPLLRKSSGSSITAVSSWWGRSGHALFAAYCASKAGLIVFAQSLAAELAPDIRVNTVCPGNINTTMHQDALMSESAERGLSFEEIKQSEWEKIPLRQAGDPEDIAAAIAFLASSEAAYITGASLDVNGGVVFH